MPTLFLSSRREDLVELMDDPECDRELLENTYRWFEKLNPLLARWRSVYCHKIRPLLEATASTRILDVGCGGGDLARQLARWAAQDGLNVDVTGIDPDPRAIQFAQSRPNPDDVHFLELHSADLARRNATFDIILSNHVLHHIEDEHLVGLMSDCEALNARLVIHNDINRDDLAWLLFWPVGLVCRRSFILTDGLRSIRRSRTAAELDRVAQTGWSVERLFPFRSLLIFEAG